MNLKQISLKWQIIVLCAFIAIVPILTVGIFGYISAKHEIYTQINKFIGNESLIINESTKNLINKRYENIYLNINKISNSIFKENPYISNTTIDVNITNAENNNTSPIKLQVLRISEESVTYNYDLLKKADSLLNEGESITIMQLIPEGLLKISSTNLIDNKRDINNYLSTDSLATKEITEGNNYYEIKIINNNQFISGFSPIKNSNGEIIGAINLIQPIEEYQNTILQEVSKYKMGKNGYIWIVDKNNNNLISDNSNIKIAELKNDNNEIIFKKARENKNNIINSPLIENLILTNEKGEKTKVVSAITYLPQEDWFIFNGEPADNFLNEITDVRNILIIIVFISIFLTLSIGYFFANHITNPLREITRISQEAASGNLNISLSKKLFSNSGEIGNLSRSLEIMITNIRQLISNLNKNINLTAASAEQLSASSEGINAAMQQISSTIEQIADGAQNVSKTAVESRDSSQQTEETAQEGSVAAKLVDQKMSIISSTTEEGSVKIMSLGEKSKEIGEIVKTINGITKQTNLLALNASIEAARAGEAGRGFAVVADEVRKLAEESEKATGKISELTNSVQAEITSSIETMGKSTEQVTEGVQSVHEALKSFETIPELIKKINLSLSDMAATSEQNAVGSGEVFSAIEQVTDSMQQVSSTAQTLSDDAKKLKAMISNFKLTDDSPSSDSEKEKTT